VNPAQAKRLAAIEAQIAHNRRTVEARRKPLEAMTPDEVIERWKQLTRGPARPSGPPLRPQDTTSEAEVVRRWRELMAARSRSEL
jgi:hypothetical protein